MTSTQDNSEQATPAPKMHGLARIIADLNPEEAKDDRILRDIHLRLQTWGEKDPERMVSVLHRNLVLWAVCKSIDAAIAGTLEAER